MPWKQSQRSRRGFTLVELLTVIAIMALMTGAAVSAVSAIKDAGSLTRGASDLTGTLDQARSYAMANNTYVFVGLTERDGVNPDLEGQGQVIVTIKGSRNGTRDFGTGGANLQELTKIRRLENLRIADGLPNTGELSRPAVTDSYRVGNEAFAAPESISARGYQFTKIIQFDPRGAASVPSSTPMIPQWIEIGLAPVRGPAAEGGENCAVLVLDGVTGSTKIYRP
jgi:prepilin-type N-terminal cleavage/methylation domain-containing protein